MSKVTFLADLYKESVQEYTKNPAEWKGLLSCVARYYKRSFDNAVLIYAQRPDASQLATFDEWHDKRINRNINRGAKGIAVIDMVNPTASIKHLFDFMDTNGDAQSFKKVLNYLWELEDQYKPGLLVKLHEKYHTPTSSIELCLYKLVQKRVRQVLPKYMENFKVHDESNILYGLPVDAVKAEFMELVTDSVAYTVFRKCGLSTELFEQNAFENISHFNSLELFMAMGSCTVSLARPILKEIHQEIQQIKIERSQIYENRTVNEPLLSAGRGRDDVSQPSNLGERGNRPDTGGQIREPVEELHVGEPPAPPVGTGGTGQNQRNDFESGRGSREPQGTADTGITGRPADAGHRGYSGESRSHEHDNLHSGGNRNQRTSTEATITETAEPPIDGKQPSMGCFFVVPPRAEPEASVSTPPQTVQPLDEEEISVLIDVVLCTDDITPDTREWVSEIHKFFEGGHKQTTKAKILKAYYGKLDTEYMTKTGDYFLHILADSEGLTFETEGQQFTASYAELTSRIDQLILMGAYPFSSADSMIDDFAIPDEMNEMQGTPDEDESEIDIDSSEAADSRYIHVFLWDQSKSLYIQQTIQNYFKEETDIELRDSPAYARFSVDGKTYSHTGIYIPEGGSQLAWVKWRTPKKPGQVTIKVSSNCSVSSNVIVADIIDLDKNPPPDPQANDRNDGFSVPSKPSRPSAMTLTWGEWDCWWHEHWVWHSGDDDENGYWEDLGWWEYAWLSYSASLNAELRTKPDEKVPTASSKVMKGGYGLNAYVSAQVRSSAPSSYITGAQNVVTYFPEFNYSTYWRLLKRLNTGYSSTFEFQRNKYSTYGRSCHFSPVWYPDGRYTTYAECLDAWTPAGMLQINLTDDLTIRGSLFDDWYIRSVK